MIFSSQVNKIHMEEQVTRAKKLLKVTEASLSPESSLSEEQVLCRAVVCDLV